MRSIGQTTPYTDHKDCQLCYAVNSSHRIPFYLMSKSLVPYSSICDKKGKMLVTVLRLIRDPVTVWDLRFFKGYFLN